MDFPGGNSVSFQAPSGATPASGTGAAPPSSTMPGSGQAGATTPGSGQPSDTTPGKTPAPATNTVKRRKQVQPENNCKANGSAQCHAGRQAMSSKLSDQAREAIYARNISEYQRDIDNINSRTDMSDAAKENAINQGAQIYSNQIDYEIGQQQRMLNTIVSDANSGVPVNSTMQNQYNAIQQGGAGGLMAPGVDDAAHSSTQMMQIASDFMFAEDLHSWGASAAQLAKESPAAARLLAKRLGLKGGKDGASVKGKPEGSRQRTTPCDKTCVATQ